MSFHEKTLWLQGATLTAVFIIYFAYALDAHALDVRPEHVAAFTGMVVLLVLAQVAGAIALKVGEKIAGQSEDRIDTDERDRLIGLKGTRNGSFVLATGVFCSLCLAVISHGNFAFTHTLLAFWVLAQLVEIGTQLFLYRRGA
jgi:hypothetical protein